MHRRQGSRRQFLRSWSPQYRRRLSLLPAHGDQTFLKTVSLSHLPGRSQRDVHALPLRNTVGNVLISMTRIQCATCTPAPLTPQTGLVRQLIRLEISELDEEYVSLTGWILQEICLQRLLLVLTGFLPPESPGGTMKMKTNLGKISFVLTYVIMNRTVLPRVSVFTALPATTCHGQAAREVFSRQYLSSARQKYRHYQCYPVKST